MKNTAPPFYDQLFRLKNAMSFEPIKVIVGPVFIAIHFFVALVITLNLSELAYCCVYKDMTKHGFGDSLSQKVIIDPVFLAIRN